MNKCSVSSCRISHHKDKIQCSTPASLMSLFPSCRPHFPVFVMIKSQTTQQTVIAQCLAHWLLCCDRELAIKPIVKAYDFINSPKRGSKICTFILFNLHLYYSNIIILLELQYEGCFLLNLSQFVIN